MSPDAAELASSQGEVHRLLGKCLVRLQHYERKLKAIIALHDLTGSVADPDVMVAASFRTWSSKTLGALIGQLVGSYFKTDGDDFFDPVTSSVAQTSGFGIRLQVGMDKEEHARTQLELASFVKLRNDLVHHFADKYDLQSLEGCTAAQQELLVSYERIDAEYGRLHEWSEEFQKIREMMQGLMDSPQYREMVVNGICPDGTIIWPLAGIVYCLRRASTELSRDGWTPVAAAAKFIRRHEPEQVPEKYGCRSLQQVLSESRLFDIERRDVNGRRERCYREREAPARVAFSVESTPIP